MQEALGCEHRQPISIDTHAGKDNPSNPGGCGEGKSVGRCGQALCPLDVVSCSDVSCSFMVVGGGVGGVGVASARPGALRRVGVVGGSCDADLRRAGRRAEAALSAVDGAASRSFAGLGNDVVAFASTWSLLDAWVVRVAEAFERADTGRAGGAGGDRHRLIGPMLPASAVRAVVVPEGALGDRGDGPTWVDALSDAEAEAAALRLAANLRPVAEHLRGAERDRVRAQLLPLVRRLRERWPAAVMSAPASSPSSASASPRRAGPTAWRTPSSSSTSPAPVVSPIRPGSPRPSATGSSAASSPRPTTTSAPRSPAPPAT